MRRSVSILGATGSIGDSTLDLIKGAPDAFEILAVTAHRDAAKLAEIARAVGAKRAVVADPAAHDALTSALSGTGIEVASGPHAVVEAAAMGADWTMGAIVGCAGLDPVMAAIAGGKTVALANKEALVASGALMMEAAKASGATILPVDSEHNAIFQCLAGNSIDHVSKITLTASGGPFRTWTRDAMAAVTPEQAVKHPNWSMGAKISIDSATMMNKGLELIEAHWLFGLESARIDVLIHPQSVVHSMVSYIDGSTIAQMGSPDMRIPIASTLAWPERMLTRAKPLDLAEIGRLDFEAPDFDRFPALRLARSAMEAGGAAPAILNAANEVAVAAFLNTSRANAKIGFLDIANIVAETLEAYVPPAPASIGDVLAVDAEARVVATRVLERYWQ